MEKFDNMNPNRGEKISLYYNDDKSTNLHEGYCMLKYYQVAKFGINDENRHEESLHTENAYGYTYYRNSIVYALKMTGVPYSIVSRLNESKKWEGLHFGQKHIGSTSFLTAIGQEWIKINKENRYAYINPCKNKDSLIFILFDKFLTLLNGGLGKTKNAASQYKEDFVCKYLERLFIIETIEYKTDSFLRNNDVSSELKKQIDDIFSEVKKDIKKQKSIKKFINCLDNYISCEIWQKIKVEETCLQEIIKTFLQEGNEKIKLILLDDFELSLLNFFSTHNINVETLNRLRLILIKILTKLNADEKRLVKTIFVLRKQQGIDKQIIGDNSPVEIYRWWKKNKEIKDGLFPEIVKVIYCKKFRELSMGEDNENEKKKKSQEYLLTDHFKGTVSHCSECEFLFDSDFFNKINYEPTLESRINGEKFEEISQKIKKYHDIFEGNVYYLLETIMSYSNVQDGCASEQICLDSQVRKVFLREWNIEAQEGEIVLLNNNKDSFEDFLEMLPFYMPNDCTYKDVKDIKKIAGRWLAKMISTCNGQGYVTTTLTRQKLKREDMEKLKDKYLRNGIVSALLDSRAIYFDYDGYEANKNEDILPEDFRYPEEVEQDKQKRSARAYQINKEDELYNYIVKWLLPDDKPKTENSVRFYKLNKFIKFICGK